MNKNLKPFLQHHMVRYMLSGLTACLFFTGSCIAQKGIQINVIEKGVKPGDNIDDSKQLQAIFNSARRGTTIFLPAGNYTIDAPMIIKVRGLTVKGEANTVLQFTNRKDYYAQYGERVGMLNVGADSITIDNLYLDQNFRNSGKADGDLAKIGGILIGCSYLGKAIRTSNITITNCTVYDYYGDAISVFHASTNNLIVKNNTAISAFIVGKWNKAGTKAEQGINVAGGNNILITGNTIEGAIDDAIATHVNCSNVEISYNHITTIGGRILVNGVKNGIIKNNEIEYLKRGWTAIMVASSPELPGKATNTKIIVEDNKITINKNASILAAIMLYSPGTDIIIRNNTITAADPQDVAIQLATKINKAIKEEFFGDNITITGNKTENFKTGVKFNFTKRIKAPAVKIENNSFSGAANQSLNDEETIFYPRFAN